MACIQPTSAVLTHLVGPRQLKLSYVYDGDQQVGFHVQLYKYNFVTSVYDLYRRFWVPSGVREFFFKLIHLGTAQDWKGYVQPLCVGCLPAQGLFSNAVVIP